MACVPTFLSGEKPTDLPPFVYRPLGLSQHTRILRLEPSADLEAPLRCSLQPVDLDTYPDYEALSYTWGLPESTESLVVEDSGHCFHLKITPNLHHGLQRLRTTVAARYLWVDAVCINQGDDNDKARQIPRMAQIYRQASSVIIWLGEHAAEAECLARLSKAITRPDDELQPAEIRKYCEALYSIPWFRRRWIIQEAVLNDDATILCGDSSASITRITRAFAKFKHGFPIMHKIAELRRGRIWNQPINNEILTLLESFAEAECSNDLDRLYAIAGLSGDVEPVTMKEQRQEHLPTSTPKMLLPVNYRQDAKSLYGSFAKALVKHYEAMSLFTKILVCASTRLQNPQHDGSWFPFWNMPALRQPLQPPQDIFSRSSAFTDSLREASVHQIVTCKKRQNEADQSGAAKGEVWLRVADLSTPYPVGCTVSELCTWIQSVFRDIGRWAQPEAVRAGRIGRYRLPSDDILLTTLFGTMTDWYSFKQNLVPKKLAFLRDFEVFRGICTGTKTITEFDLTQSPVREIARAMRSRRVVKWDIYLTKYSGARGDGGPQNERLADADPGNLAQPLHHSGLVYPPNASFRVGIAPDLVNIDDELVVAGEERLEYNNFGMYPGPEFGWNLRRGFVFRLSHEQCDYGYKAVPHYNLIGECALVHECASDPWYYGSMNSRLVDFDMCLH